MTSICNVSPGCTLLVPVVYVTVKKPFKYEIPRLFEDHLDKRLELYAKGKFSTSQQRILMTKWVDQAWKKISGMKELSIRNFKKCCLSVALDASKNAPVSIDSIPNYEMSQQFVEEQFKLLDDDEDEDEDASENDEKRRILPFDCS